MILTPTSITAITITTLAIILAMVFYVFTPDKVEDEPAPDYEICEVGKIHEDGSVTFSQSNPGTSELLILQTTTGIKVLAKCK